MHQSKDIKQSDKANRPAFAQPAPTAAFVRERTQPLNAEMRARKLASSADASGRSFGTRMRSASAIFQTPSTGHVVSATACLEALGSSHAQIVLVDARNPSLVALERVAGAIAFEGSTIPSLCGRTALVYDAGSNSLAPPYSRAANVVFSLLESHPFDARVCLVSGGLPALRETAPRLVVCAPRSATEVNRLREKLAGMAHAPKWARAALESLIDAAKPAAPVLPWLDVGSDSDARSLPTMLSRGYTHVLAVGEELRVNFGSTFEYCHIPALDVSSYRIIADFPLVVHFLRGVRARAEAGDNVRVLVHCFAGMSRSVAAVAAFFAAEGIPVQSALRHIASHRVGAAPNHGFLTQLSEWELQLQGPHPPVDGPRMSKLQIPFCCGLKNGIPSSCGLKNAVQTRRPSELEREILKECRQDEMEVDCRSMSPITPDVNERHVVSEANSKVPVKDENTKVWTSALSRSEENEDVAYSPGTFPIPKKGFNVGLMRNKNSCSPKLRPMASYELLEYCDDDSGLLEGLEQDTTER